MFRLERGATGFRHVSEPELPVVDVRLFRAGCFAAARPGGVVEFTSEGSFHAAVITTVTGRLGVRCHRHHPWIAVTEGEIPVAAFFDPVFTILGREVLELPLSAVDTSALSEAEWTQIRYWQPETVGQAVFNFWD